MKTAVVATNPDLVGEEFLEKLLSADLIEKAVRLSEKGLSVDEIKDLMDSDLKIRQQNAAEEWKDFVQVKRKKLQDLVHTLNNTPDIGNSALRVAVTILLHSDFNNEVKLTPTQISKITGITRGRTYTALKLLEKLKFIYRTNPTNKGDNGSDLATMGDNKILITANGSTQVGGIIIMENICKR